MELCLPKIMESSCFKKLLKSYFYIYPVFLTFRLGERDYNAIDRRTRRPAVPTCIVLTTVSD